MAYWLSALAALQENLSSAPSTHAGQLRAACNFHSRAFSTSSGLCGYWVCVRTHMQTHKHGTYMHM